MYELIETGRASYGDVITVSKAYNRLAERFLIDVMGYSLAEKGLNNFKQWSVLFYKDAKGFWFAKMGNKSKIIGGMTLNCLVSLLDKINTDIVDVAEVELKDTDLYDISSVIDRKDVVYRLAFDVLGKDKKVRIRGIEVEVNGLGWSSLLNQRNIGFSGIINRWAPCNSVKQDVRKKLQAAYKTLNAEHGFVRILDTSNLNVKIPKGVMNDNVVIVDRVKYLLCDKAYTEELLALLYFLPKPARSITWECDVMSGLVSSSCFIRDTEIDGEYDYLIMSK